MAPFAHLFDFENKNFLNILLMDDSSDSAGYLQGILSREKYFPFDLVVAHNREEAEAAIYKEHPDLAIIGFHADNVFGIEEFLIQFPWVIAVVIADKNDPLKIPSLFRAGAEEVLLKEDVTVGMLWRSIACAFHRHQQHANLKRIIENNTDGILVVDKKDQILFHNKAAEELFHPKRTIQIGQKSGLLAGDHEPREIELVDDETGYRILELRSVDVIWGMVSGYLVSLRDITERKRISEEMMQSDRLAGIGALAAGISHEVLNPLNIISMNVQMKKRKDVSPEWEKFLDGIQDEVKRIEKILQTLLKFSRKGEGKLRRIDVHETLEETLSLMEESLLLSNIEVVREMNLELPEVHVDPDQLRQVLLNVVQNAQHAMQKGGRLTIRTTHRKDNNGPLVEIAIVDTGSGIKQKDLKRVMEPFFTTKPEGIGTGLGLAVCHGIMNQFGGSLAIDSVEGQGTSVYLRFPVSSAAE